jgi:hypothetical protein
MAPEFTTKYWIVVSVLALVLLVGSGALSVWICKIYDTDKTATLPPGVSPFPDVVPIVNPPATDPTLNMCYKWCGNKECPNGTSSNPCTNNSVCIKPTTCSNDGDCQSKCSVPNSVTLSPVCTSGVCSPPYQTCISGFSNPNPDPSNLKQCITSQDCNVCTDVPVGQQMACVYVEDSASITLCDGTCTIDGVPGGYYCLPERTGCDAHAGTATWTGTGWDCICRWSNVMNGPECNILYACDNQNVTDGTKSLQQLLVNCDDPNNAFCGKPWVPESGIDPTGQWDKTIGFGTVGSNYDSSKHGAVPMPNCVCQCDGTQKNTNKGYTYDARDPLVCVTDSCSSGAWGRSLLGDAAYELNCVPGVVHSLFAPTQNQYLSLASNDVLQLSTSDTAVKFQMLPKGVLKAFALNDNSYVGTSFLATNADGSKVGDTKVFGETPNPGADSQTWVLTSVTGYPTRPDNLDNLILYNPKWSRPTGAQYSDQAYNDQTRFLIYKNGAFSLGTLSDPVVVLQRVGSKTENNTDYIDQPLTNCACSGANSVSSLPACFDDNDNFVNFVSLMSADDQSKCNATYSRNVSAVCDPYVIPNSVITVQPTDDSKKLCDLYTQDLKTLNSSLELPTSTNLIPFRSGFVPGLNTFINPLTGVEQLMSVCTQDPCTGRYGDAAYSLQNNSGFWDALNGTCACVNGNTDDTTQNYYPFAVDQLNNTWNKSCKDGSTSGACICNHITNPVCAVCQNACSGSTFCKSSPEYPCVDSNISCDTSTTTGGAKCVCKGNCLLQPGTADLCMAQIPDNGMCKGLEGEPGVCQAGQNCQKMAKMYDWTYTPPNGLTVYNCSATGDVVSYCSSSDKGACWDSTSPLNAGGDACEGTVGLEKCPT